MIALRLSMLPALVLLAFMPPPSVAGANTAGTARLSWDRAGGSTDLAAAPSGPFSLFLLIENAPDIRSLAVELKWTPADSVTGYTALSAAAETSCGAAIAVPPGGNFEGDSTYSWSIIFSPTVADKGCAVFSFGVPADSTFHPAQFCLTGVKVKDSTGSVDDLAIVSGATIRGGTDSGCPIAISSVSPRTLIAGEQTLLTIKGTNFAAGASVELRMPGLTLPASSVQVVSPRELTGSVAIPDSVDAPLDLVVSLVDGRWAELGDAVQSKQLWWGFWIDSTSVVSGKMGSGVPLFRQDVPTNSTRTATIVNSQVTLTAPCHSVPFCTVPFGGTGLFGPSTSGPMPTNCRRLQPTTSVPSQKSC